MANDDNPYGFQPYKSEGGTGAFPLEYGTADSGTTLAAGDAVVRSSDGYVAIATAGSTTILGVAAKAVTATTGEQPALPYYPAIEQITFVGQCSGTMAQTDIGEAQDIEGTTGIMEIDEDGGSTGVLRIVGLKPGSAIGANAELLFKWTKSAYTGQA